MSRIFATHARAYWDRGLSVIPIIPGEKSPPIKGWQGLCNGAPGLERQAEMLKRYPDHGIGLLMNTEVGARLRIVAVDVDDDRFVRLAKAILGRCVSGKKGAKGATFFATYESGSIKSTSFGKIDILAGGKQTVMPPTLHPATGKPYKWLGAPLLECDFAELPRLDAHKIEVLRLVVQAEQTTALLSGEQTHDAGVSLTASLVASQCSDEEITAIIEALLPEDYRGDSLKELPGWIGSAREKGFAARPGAILDLSAAEIVASALAPVVYLAGEGFRQYRDGCWELLDVAHDIDRASTEALQTILKRGKVGPHLNDVRRMLALSVHRRRFGRSSDLIGLRNGAFSVSKRELLPHAPGNELRFKLDFDFDKDANCPIYEEQLRTTFAGDQASIDTFEEFAAHTLVPEMRFQKALYLMGPGGSGKSTLLRVLQSMHANSAVSATSLEKIESERYLTDVATKLVCISFDVQGNRPIFGEVFTRISGGDPVATRRLFHEVDGHVVPTVRFIGSMNPDIPPAIASRDALRRRLIFLTCGGRVERPDIGRLDQLLAERSSIFQRWMVALARLNERGAFEPPASSHDEVEAYTMMHDPFAAFASEQLVRDDAAKTRITEIVRWFSDWAETQSERRLPASVIVRKLRTLGFGLVQTATEFGLKSLTVRARHASSAPKDCPDF